jgi:hypothetical protein
MGTPGRPRIGPDDAERLLTTGRDAAHPGLSRLLAAAAAPPRPGELAGLRAAVAAFEEAGRYERPAATPRRRRALRPLAAAAALAAMLAGGVAVAAETGNLPGRPVTDHSAPVTGAPPETTTRPAPSHSGTATAPQPPGDRGRTLSPTSPAVAGLCRAWDAHRRNPRKDPITAEAMRDLVAAAGGEDRIPAYCAAVLARPGTHQPTPSHPTGKPAAKPTPSTARKG